MRSKHCTFQSYWVEVHPVLNRITYVNSFYRIYTLYFGMFILLNIYTSAVFVNILNNYICTRRHSMYGMFTYFLR